MHSLLTCCVLITLVFGKSLLEQDQRHLVSFVGLVHFFFLPLKIHFSSLKGQVTERGRTRSSIHCFTPEQHHWPVSGRRSWELGTASGAPTGV